MPYANLLINKKYFQKVIVALISIIYHSLQLYGLHLKTHFISLKKIFNFLLYCGYARNTFLVFMHFHCSYFWGVLPFLGSQNPALFLFTIFNKSHPLCLKILSSHIIPSRYGVMQQLPHLYVLATSVLCGYFKYSQCTLCRNINYVCSH